MVRRSSNRNSRRLRRRASRTVVRDLARISNHIPVKARAPVDPPRRPNGRTLSLVLAYQCVLTFGSTDSQTVDPPTPRGNGTIQTMVSGTTSSGWTLSASASWLSTQIAYVLGFTPNADVTVGYDIALKKVTIWGPSVTDQNSASQNVVQLFVSGAAIVADYSASDTGTSTRRACVSVAFPASNWWNYTSTVAILKGSFGSAYGKRTGTSGVTVDAGYVEIALEARPGYVVSGLKSDDESLTEPTVHVKKR